MDCVTDWLFPTNDKSGAIKMTTLYLSIEANMFFLLLLFALSLLTFIISTRSKGIYKSTIAMTGAFLIGISVILPSYAISSSNDNIITISYILSGLCAIAGLIFIFIGIVNFVNNKD